MEESGLKRSEQQHTERSDLLWKPGQHMAAVGEPKNRDWCRGADPTGQCTGFRQHQQLSLGGFVALCSKVSQDLGAGWVNRKHGQTP